MGCVPSKSKKRCELRPFLVVRLASETVFTVNEVEALFELFRSISNAGGANGGGLINKEKFNLALFDNKSKDNLFANRVFNLFDVNHKGAIDFSDFVHALNIFHPNAPQHVKVDFSFRLYDLESIGHIDRLVVKQLLKALFLENDVKITDDSLHSILDQTFSVADVNGDGKIDKEDWQIFVGRHPTLMNIMTLSHLRDITTAFPGFIGSSEVEYDE